MIQVIQPPLAYKPGSGRGKQGKCEENRGGGGGLSASNSPLALLDYTCYTGKILPEVGCTIILLEVRGRDFALFKISANLPSIHVQLNETVMLCEAIFFPSATYLLRRRSVLVPKRSIGASGTK